MHVEKRKCFENSFEKVENKQLLMQELRHKLSYSSAGVGKIISFDTKFF